MKADIERRAFGCPVELRQAGDGRTLSGMVLPFDEPTEIHPGLVEQFVRGAFSRTIEERASKVKLLVGHDHNALPIGSASLLREEPGGLVAEFRVADTPRGNEVLALASQPDPALEWSIGFVPVSERMTDLGVRTITEAKLMEVSAVTWGAYRTETLGVRSAPAPYDELDLLTRRLHLYELT